MRTFQVCCFIALFVISSFKIDAQSVVVTDDAGYTAHPSAVLDVKSDSKGFLVPRLTNAQMNALADPATGLLIFNVDKKSFCYRTETSWLELSSGILPELAGANDALFHVINSAGDTVFAVYPEGVRINVGDGNTKGTGSKGGFAVGGFTTGKDAGKEFLRVTSDSVRVYIDTASSKGIGSKGGFAVGGFTTGKGLAQDFLRVTDDSVRIYIDPGAAKGTGSKGGFAVGGFTTGKSLSRDLLRVSEDSIRIYVSNNPGKGTGSKGGFAVGGFTTGKSSPNDLFNISYADSTEIINPSQARMLWYPAKEAFLAGRVLIESVDNVGTNSWATGYQSKASGDYSQALGYSCVAEGDYSTAIGKNASAVRENSFAFGDGASVSTLNSYAFGKNARTTIGYGYMLDDANFAIGQDAQAAGSYSYAFGKDALAVGTNAFSFGQAAKATKSDCYAFGLLAHASDTGAFAIGSKSFSAGWYSMAIGSSQLLGSDSTLAKGRYSYAIGKNAFAIGNYSFAIGSGEKLGGVRNLLADGLHSMVFGAFASSNGKSGGFLFGDYSAIYTASDILNATANNQFMARAIGGYVFYTDQLLTESKTFFIQPNSGAVGIGNASPDHKLTVTGTDNNLLRLIGTGANGSGSRITMGDANKIYFEEDEDNKLKINVVDRLAIMGEYGLRVGIGVDNPDYKLTIYGSNVSNKVLQLLGEGFGTAYGAILAFGNDDKNYVENTNTGLKIKTNALLEIAGESGFKVNINNVSSADHTVNIKANSSNQALKLMGIGTFFGEGAKLTFGDNDLAYLQEDEDNSLLFYATNRIALNSSNSAFKVGIKTTNPSTLLDIGGGIMTNISSNGKNLLVANDVEIDRHLYVEGNVSITGSTKIGANGTSLGSIIKALPYENLPSIPAGTSYTHNFTVTNAAVGATVCISPGSALPDKLIIAYARVSAADNVEVKFYNASSSAIDLDWMSYYITVTY